jgi:phosphate-selective porin OprO/OprP
MAGSRSRGRGLLTSLATLLLALVPRVLAAQTVRAPDAGVPAPASDASSDASPPETDPARAQAEGAAAQRAAQELEVRVIELRRELDGLERQRASWDDLRRRLDELEARQRQEVRGPADWASLPGPGDGSGPLRFSRNGFAIRSPGNRFLVRPGLRLQSVYEGRLAAAGPDDHGARSDASTIRLAHAELLFEGHAGSPRFEYRFELDVAETSPGIAKDAFVQARFWRSLAIRVGQFKVPFGLQTQIWNGALELVDVASATAAFSLDRDVGVMVVGRPLAGRLQYHLAAMNGPRAPCPPDPQLGCDAVDLAYAARIVAAPFGPLPVTEGDLEGSARPLLQVGVSGAFELRPTDVRARTGNLAAPLDLDGNHLVDNVSVWQAAAELRALFRGASVQGEWFGRREHPGGLEGDRSYWGAYGQASFFVLPRRLQVLARAGRTDLPLFGALALERAARGTTTTDAGGGVSAYLHGHDAKLQVDYSYLSTPDAGSAPHVHRLRAAVQLAF